ncbi:MAG: hypothetical protein SFU99_14170 [Saprospiraceae bacterium]|nr:hypothetical protein [Saprospiraceae bacterium]
MKSLTIFLLLVGGLIMLYAYSKQTTTNINETKSILVASTPGGIVLKSMLGIPIKDSIDFIRWNLTIQEDRLFVLNLHYGLSQPNTLGFQKDGERLNLQGTYTITSSKKKTLNGVIYTLKSDAVPAPIRFIQVNNNVFHLLDDNDQLMIGNGGWSYTLNRKDVIADETSVLPALTPADAFLNDTALQRVYDGRTPCAAIAKTYHLPVGNDCFKLKWRLILHRDPKTLKPTTYTINRIKHSVEKTEAKWAIQKGYGNNPDAVVIQLNPDKPDESLSFLVGDENVLFFLDNKKQLFTGNPDFSYTLNKVK